MAVCRGKAPCQTPRRSRAYRRATLARTIGDYVAVHLRAENGERRGDLLQRGLAQRGNGEDARCQSRLDILSFARTQGLSMQLRSDENDGGAVIVRSRGDDAVAAGSQATLPIIFQVSSSGFCAVCSGWVASV